MASHVSEACHALLNRHALSIYIYYYTLGSSASLQPVLKTPCALLHFDEDLQILFGFTSIELLYNGECHDEIVLNGCWLRGRT